ncbi:ATP-binding cassette domain-containing protein [bacterium]|nr:ATP-binding cassette domain-containing protein [bacterium]
MIKVQNLTKFYGKTAAIDGISFQVNKGEIVGFLGPNGAGKSTTMKILTCFLPPTSGEAEVCGFSIFQNSMEIKKRIGYLPENPPLYKEMKVRSYLEFVANLKGVPFSQVKSFTNEAIEKCNLQSYSEFEIFKLSKGYKQRVGLAQALIHKPELLILDEPTSGLDPTQIHEVRNLITSLAGKHTILLSTHILPEVSMTCEKVVIINKGKIAACDSVENLTRSFALTYTLKVRGENTEKLISELHQIPEVSSVDLETNETLKIKLKEDRETAVKISNCAFKNEFLLLELKKEAASLEEVFIKLVFTE